jgi:esterase/lipase superfamily enzyme
MRKGAFVIILGLLFGGCAAPQTYDLMPTPILYVDSSIDPFAHLSEEHKSPRSHVYYATNRIPEESLDKTYYSNGIAPDIRFGRATIRMGEPNLSWDKLEKSSLSARGSEPIPVILEEVEEKASVSQADNPTDIDIPSELTEFFSLINAEMSTAVDKELMVYVHGTKVDFTNSTVLAAEVEHFGGRDFVSLAFAWPSHQNIFSYLLGIDVNRAQESSTALANVLILLAESTIAEKINILSYSAGGRVTSKALYELRNMYSQLNTTQLRDTFRIGTVVYAAADVEVDVFLERLGTTSELSDQVVITLSDKDNALQAAKKYMGGTVRAGTSEAEDSETTYIAREGLGNVSIIDVSLGQQVRGFDIVGHHYWYRHPWMSSDIIFLMRTDLPPNRRGLQPTEHDSVWYLSSDYPRNVRDALKTELGSQW